MVPVSALIFYSFVTAYASWFVQSLFAFKDCFTDWWEDIEDDEQFEEFFDALDELPSNFADVQ